MKCKDCEFVRKGFFSSEPETYVCIGVREPFEVDENAEHPCGKKKINKNIGKEEIMSIKDDLFVINRNIDNELKNINNRLDDISDDLKKEHEHYNNIFSEFVTNSVNKFNEIVEKQDDIIQNLLKSQVNKNDFDCIVLVPKRSNCKPVVIKGGNVISTDTMTSFTIKWNEDSNAEAIINSIV